MLKKIILIILIIFSVFIVGALCYMDKEYFICPIDYKGGIVVRCDSGGNGFFASPRNGNRLHEGIDLSGEVGAPVFASRSGKVISAAENRGMGKYIIVQHTGGIITIYGHLSGINVTKGQFVRQKQVIGAVGKTGNANYRSIQAHLHFEVRKDGVPRDPLNYLG
jgi:murein DD-endopeptidase MepM/ murein hydrolase activator NlpD